MQQQVELATRATAGGAGTGRLAAAVVVAVAAVHLGLVLLTFALQHRDARRRGQAPPLASYVRAALSEWCCSLAYLLLMPVGWLPRLGPDAAAKGGGPPVLLVHGYFVNRACMLPMLWRLRRRGFRNTYTVNLHSMLRGIEQMAERLHGRIHELSRLHEGARVVAVGHSMGGLVLRWLLQTDPDLPLARVITIGTPHRGTRTALIGFTAAALEMRPGSAFLRALEPEPARPVVSVYSPLDNMIVPADSAAFGPRPVALGGLGHVALLFSGRVFATVLGELRRHEEESSGLRPPSEAGERPRRG